MKPKLILTNLENLKQTKTKNGAMVNFYLQDPTKIWEVRAKNKTNYSFLEEKFFEDGSFFQEITFSSTEKAPIDLESKVVVFYTNGDNNTKVYGRVLGLNLKRKRHIYTLLGTSPTRSESIGSDFRFLKYEENQ